MIEFTYNSDEDIIYTKRTGEIPFSEIVEYIQSLHQAFHKLDNLYVFDDCRGSSLVFNNTSDLEPVIGLIKDLIHHYKVAKTAILVDHPEDTAINMIHNSLTTHIANYHLMIFSTEEAAKKWLLH